MTSVFILIDYRLMKQKFKQIKLIQGSVPKLKVWDGVFSSFFLYLYK